MLLLSLLACSGETAVLVTLEGRVQDYASGTGLTEASLLFESPTGATIVEATTNDVGDWQATLVLPYDPENGAEVFGYVDRAGHVPTTVHHRLRFRDVEGSEGAIHPGRMQEPRAIAVEPYDLAPEADQDGVVSGRVFDAVVANQAAGIGGLTLTIREGIGATEDAPIVAYAATDTFPNPGEYRIPGLPAGTYTIEVDGHVGDEQVWSNTSFTAVSVGGTESADQNGATSVALAEDQFRVVLSWGQDPADVDSHLSGPGDPALDTSVLDGRFHVFYGNKSYPAGADPTAAVVFLDVDDTSSFGPETITVRRADPGVYKYVLHDYTNRSAQSGSTALSRSRSKVQVFVGGGESETFYIPPGREGTTWTVFEMDGNRLRPSLVSQYGFSVEPTGDIFY